MAVKLSVIIDGDSSPLAKALISAMNAGEKVAAKSGEVAGSRFGKEFSQQLKGRIMNVLGAGAIVQAIKHQIAEATKITEEAAKKELGVEAMQELQRAAELTGMTIDEIQETAPKVAEEFTKMMNAIREGGGILDKETVQILADAGKDFKELGAKIAGPISMLVKAVNFILHVYLRAGRAAVETLTGVGQAGFGALGGGRENIEAGMEMINEAWRGGGWIPGARTTDMRDAAGGFVGASKSEREAERQRRHALIESFKPLRMAGAQRDMETMSMIPGGTKEMLDALNKAVFRLESIDQNLK